MKTRGMGKWARSSAEALRVTAIRPLKADAGCGTIDTGSDEAFSTKSAGCPFEPVPEDVAPAAGQMLKDTALDNGNTLCKANGFCATMSRLPAAKNIAKLQVEMLNMANRLANRNGQVAGASSEFAEVGGASDGDTDCACDCLPQADDCKNSLHATCVLVNVLDVLLVVVVALAGPVMRAVVKAPPAMGVSTSAS